MSDVAMACLAGAVGGATGCVLTLLAVAIIFS